MNDASISDGDKVSCKIRSWRRYIVENPNFTGCLVDTDDNIAWVKNGLLHRDNGPAFKHFTGYNEWWLNGEEFLDEQEHRIAVRQMKLKLLDDSIQ